LKQFADTEDRTGALLRVAQYLVQPQRFMAVGDARAELRHTLELATKGSVILTAHGEPEAAVVPFSTLEDMRRALLHLLVEQMESTFARTRKRLGYEGTPVFDEAMAVEAQRDIGEVLRKAKRRSGKARRTLPRK